MKKFAFIILLAFALPLMAQKVVLLHTNDTHSHIDAENGVGGVLQRKAMIDSIRKKDKNVMLIDAGDVVQGSLYFKLFGGEVEYPLMDLMGYDIQILGNHEFDNGLDDLAKYYKRSGAAKLAANYDFTDTPLKGVFDPYVIKTFGKKKIGFMGIGLDPEGIIDSDNYKGMGYSDIIETANRTAAELRAKGCDAVVAVTHIGYSNDTKKPLVTDADLARQSHGIDLIIGGHSHEIVTPANPANPWTFTNADGKEVHVVQTGRYGANLGLVELDLGGSAPDVTRAELLPVAGVDMSRPDRKIQNFLSRYSNVVDSINRRVIALCDVDMPNTKNYYTSTLFSNYICDVAAEYAAAKLDSISGGVLPTGIDLAIMNCGGIRLPMPKGPVTEGQILSTFPFTNHLEVVSISGSRLRRLLNQVAALGNQGVSASVQIAVSPAGEGAAAILLHGSPIDDESTYYVATLDYLARGGDYLTEFAGAKTEWTDPNEWCAAIMEAVVNAGKAGLPIAPDPQPRLRPFTPLP